MKPILHCHLLDPNSPIGQHDILRIFLAILSWEAPAHAGFPMWCNDSEMGLPTSTTGDESCVQVKKFLQQSLCIRGRASQVFLMSTLDPSCGLFSTPKHYDSFLAYHDDNSPVTNRLFLPASDVELKPYFRSLFRSEPPSLPDYHGLWVYVSSAYADHSLVSADSPKMLIESVLHACLGMWL